MSKTMGIGMILAEEEEHKFCDISRYFNQQLTFQYMRMSFQPAFTFRRIEDLYPSFWSISLELVDAIKEQSHFNKSTNENSTSRNHKSSVIETTS